MGKRLRYLPKSQLNCTWILAPCVCACTWADTETCKAVFWCNKEAPPVGKVKRFSFWTWGETKRRGTEKTPSGSWHTFLGLKLLYHFILLESEMSPKHALKHQVGTSDASKQLKKALTVVQVLWQPVTKLAPAYRNNNLFFLPYSFFTDFTRSHIIIPNITTENKP